MNFKYLIWASVLMIALGSMLMITAASMREDEIKQQCENVEHGKFLTVRNKSLCLKSDAIIWIK
jgi:hypothetical protein